MVHRMLERGPQMLNGIGPPRTPTRAVFQQSPFTRGQAQPFGGHLKAQVAGGKSIWVAKAAHRNYLCGPGTDPRQGEQLPSRTFPVTSAVQDHGSVGEAG